MATYAVLPTILDKIYQILQNPVKETEFVFFFKYWYDLSIWKRLLECEIFYQLATLNLKYYKNFDFWGLTWKSLQLLVEEGADLKFQC